MRAFLVLLLVALATITVVYADPVAPTDLQVFSTGSRTLGGAGNGTIGAQGGNVTQINVDALSITSSWQGYFGNVSGNFHLDDADNNSFYTWGNATLSGEIFATRNDTIVWTNVNCTNSTERTDEETYLGQTWVDGDSVTKTYNRTTHPQIQVVTNTIDAHSCFSTNMNVNGTSQNSTFYQMLLSDNTSNIIYTTIIEDDEYAYNSQLADFQLMVGENEKAGNEGPTTYYFWTELD